MRAVPKPKPEPRGPIPPLAEHQVLAPSQTALALKLVTKMDLLRLKSIARLYARGLPPDVSWDDLLQEAITRVLTGKRVKPADVPMVAFLGGIMRSLRSDHIRRVLSGTRSEREVLDPAADPERALIAADELKKIQLLFADDPLALRILHGLADGSSAEQIRARHRISRTDYDSTRKRMRRCLIREGLTCGKM